MPIIDGAGLGTPLQNAGAPTAGVNEVQTITPDAVGASGTFRVCFDGYRTGLLAYNISAANMQVALRALPSIGSAGCTVTLGGGPPQLYTVTFAGNLAAQAQALMTIEDNTVLDAGLAAVTLTVAESVAGVTATGRGAAPGAILIDTTNKTFYVNTGTALVPVWTLMDPLGTTASAAELNLIDTSVAGTAVPSKAAVLGANKELDEFHTAALYLGAAAGTLITPTAAQLNLAAVTTPGTAEASKIAVLGASKNLDVLGLPVGGLKIGAAGAEVATTMTAAELNELHSRDVVYCLVHRVTAAEVNAGHEILADAAGVVITPLSVKMRAIGGAAGTTTSVDLTDTVAAAIAAFPRAILTQNAMAGEYSANVVSTGIGVAQTSGKGLKVIKNGGDLDTATHIDVIVTYTVS